MSKRKRNAKARNAMGIDHRGYGAQTRARVLRGAAADPAEYRATHTADGPGGLAIEPQPVRQADSNGRPGVAHRTLDTLAELRRRGTISPVLELAGRTFQEDFRAAGLDRLRAASLYRLPQGRHEETDFALMARHRVYGAIDRLGGMDGAPAKAVWGVLGEGRSISDCAACSQMANGRSPHRELVRGFLLGALHVLAWHYRLDTCGSQNRKTGREKT